jgi:hypothetical protein
MSSIIDIVGRNGSIGNSIHTYALMAVLMSVIRKIVGGSSITPLP